MDTLYFLTRFFYRIRFPLILGTALATLLAIFFTRFLPTTYSVTTTVFTGITSKPSLDDMSAGADWNFANNAHDNIINLVRSKSTLQSISMTLLAQHLIYGSPDEDNMYIQARHYRDLMKIVPEDVLTLVDKSSLENTVANFAAYRTEDRHNFIYAIFSWKHKHYSYYALSKIQIRRMQSSDMIEISYDCNDPGIAANTVALLNKELAERWEELMLSTSNNVVKHFEEQLKIAEHVLRATEDTLVMFNTQNRIINYEEQTKHLAALNNSFESRFEEILLANKSSKALLDELERQMETRVKLVRENETFLSVLEEISTLNGQIAEIEIFGGTDGSKNSLLEEYRAKLADAESRIRNISSQMDSYKQSKEGVAITAIVDNWLEELLKYAKSNSELEVMNKRREEIEAQYAFYSPVGPNLNRLDRSVRVAEESYLTLLHHLGLAKLKQKNILLNSGTLQVVTPPEFPLLSKPKKRKVYVLAAFIGAFVFISGLFLLLELLDRTLRNKHRTENFTGGRVIAAIPQPQNLRHRRFDAEILRIASLYLANQVNERILPSKERIFVNILSLDPGEGKSFVSENLWGCWEDMGFTVETLSHGKDFNSDSKRFLQTTRIADLTAGSGSADIVVTEYAALRQSSVPADLIAQADINIVVMNAERPWKDSDKPLFENLTRMSGDTPLFICLNRAGRDAVEEIVGQLPPYTKWRSVFYKWYNFGITARSV